MVRDRHQSTSGHVAGWTEADQPRTASPDHEGHRRGGEQAIMKTRRRRPGGRWTRWTRSSLFVYTRIYNFSKKRVQRDRKSTRLNSSHVEISYAVFCLKKKKKN